MLVSEEALVDELGVTAEVAGRIARFLPEAKAYLVVLKGAAWYEAREAEPVTERPRSRYTEADEDRALAERAEALLALYYGLPLLNLSLRDGGGVLSVVYETTPEGATTQTRFATAEGLDGLRRELLTQAKLLVGGDAAAVLDPEDDGTVVGVNNPVGGSGWLGAVE